MAKETKKRHWVKILAPKEFDSIVLGETITLENKNLIGRKLDVNLFFITRDFKKQNSNLSFMINNVSEGQANTELYKYYISMSHIRRLVKNSKDKIEDSFIAETKDKAKVQIKPIIITRKKVSNSVLTNLLKTSRTLLSRHLNNISFTDFVREIISGRVQSTVKHSLNKIYPLSLYDLKIVEKL